MHNLTIKPVPKYNEPEYASSHTLEREADTLSRPQESLSIPSSPVVSQAPSKAALEASEPLASPSNAYDRAPSPESVRSKNVSPRRSFYLHKSVPAASDIALAAELLANLPDESNDELIFDDHDDRLPPPEGSPVSSNKNVDGDLTVTETSPEKLPERLSPPLPVGSPVDAPASPLSPLDPEFEQEFGYVPVFNSDGEEVTANSRPTSEVSPSVFSEAAAEIEREDSPEVVAESLVDHSDDPNLTEPQPGGLFEEVDLSEMIPDILRASSNGLRLANYPAPIPKTLVRPPKLSGRRHSRSSSFNLPPAPDWSKSPNLEHESVDFITTTPDGAKVLPYEPEYQPQNDWDVESDRATIMSDDRDSMSVAGESVSESTDTRSTTDKQGKKHRKWYQFLKKSRKVGEDEELDEMGEVYDNREADALRKQMAVLDDDFAFSRLDPETIEQNIQMFNIGGIHDRIAPNKGGMTSLIEELEIRKAGRRMQRQILLREVTELERQRQEDMARTNWDHPASSRDAQPTLLQMQYMADIDYQTRVQWHKRAVNRHYIQDHAEETLAQRRARLRTEKGIKKREQIEAAPIEETLAQRRARLRQEKLFQSAQSSVISQETSAVSY